MVGEDGKGGGLRQQVVGVGTKRGVSVEGQEARGKLPVSPTASSFTSLFTVSLAAYSPCCCFPCYGSGGGQI